MHTNHTSTLFTLFLSFCGLSGSVFAEKIPYFTDIKAAKVAAAEQKKDLFLEFTGSDWCTWCIVMKRKILDKEEFYAATKDQFIFVELDYPKKKKLAAEIQAQNKALDKEYKIEGYPTIILTDSAGKAYALSEYEEGDTVESYVAELQELRKIHKLRDEAFTAAENAKTPQQKAKFLLSGLMAMKDDVVETFYADVLDKLIALDREGTAEYVNARKAAIQKKAAEK